MELAESIEIDDCRNERCLLLLLQPVFQVHCILKNLSELVPPRSRYGTLDSLGHQRLHGHN